MSTTDHFPILGIQEFQPTQQPVHDLQYLDVQGEQHIDRPHKHDFFMLLLFEEGSGTHNIDFEEYVVEGTQLHLLLPGQVHRWNLGENTQAYQLMISRPVSETFSSSLELSFVFYQKHPLISLAPDTFRKLRYEFLAVRDELNAKPADWTIIKLRSQIIAQLFSHEVESRHELLPKAGDAADLVLVEASCSAEAVSRVSPVKSLIHKGEIVY